ncbi:MAG: YicC family protein [Prevotellaceae bacterium]|nr:YicC family protein [Prevotellaceae bacterium]
MIESMTGYGKATGSAGGKKIVVEVKSLNSKALDLSSRVAPAYREREMELRAAVAKRLERGKVDFSLWTEKDEPASADSPLNGPQLGIYYRGLLRLCREQDIPEPDNPWLTLMRMPDIFLRQEPQGEVTPEEWDIVNQTMEEALRQLVDFRRQEGEALRLKLDDKLDRIASLLQSAEPLEKSRVEKIRQRITDGLQSLRGVDYDQGRLEQEMIYYIEKLDVSEEKQRLSNHLRYFRETMDGGHGQGKKLGFIAQEMGREINTLGSKSNQAEMQNLVVMMKDELEQIKEQVLNIL